MLLFLLVLLLLMNANTNNAIAKKIIFLLFFIVFTPFSKYFSSHLSPFVPMLFSSFHPLHLEAAHSRCRGKDAPICWISDSWWASKCKWWWESHGRWWPRSRWICSAQCHGFDRHRAASEIYTFARLAFTSLSPLTTMSSSLKNSHSKNCSIGKRPCRFTSSRIPNNLASKKRIV